MTTFDEACAALTAPGQPLELIATEIRGRTYPVFANAPSTLVDTFAAAADRGEMEFLVYEDKTWSFADVVDHGHAFATALVRDYGIEKGDRVAIAMRNYPEWITSLVGIVAAGGVAVPLNAWWEAEELEYGLRDSGSKVVIVDIERLDRVRGLIESGDVRAILVRGGGNTGDADSYDEIVEPGTPPPGRVDRAGRRRNDHVHLRHHRRGEGRGAHTSQSHTGGHGLRLSSVGLRRP